MAKLSEYLAQHRAAIATHPCPWCQALDWDNGSIVALPLATERDGAAALYITKGAHHASRMELNFTCGACRFSAAFYLADLELSPEALAAVTDR